MKLKLLLATSRTASFEIENSNCYYSPAPLTVFANGEKQGEFTTNVFTLFNLTPAMLYTVTVSSAGNQGELTFITPGETAVLNVHAFGASGQAEQDATAAISAAIACCPDGGTVLFPAGEYCSGPLFLKSNITLYFEKGVRLFAWPNRQHYPVLPGIVETENGGETSFGTWEGNPLDCFASLLTGIHLTNVTIAGQGCIDGSGSEGDWWDNVRTKRTAWRPRTIFLNHCKQCNLVGVSVQNSPSWTIHPYFCTDITIVNITVTNPIDSPNTDGINPESTQNMLIAGVKISVGDDCIAIKSGKFYMGTTRNVPSNNIQIRNCLMEKGHGAVVIGSEISAGTKAITVENCRMEHTDRGLRVKTRRGRGKQSVITSILFKNVTMDYVKTPFAMNMFYFCDPDGHSRYVQNKGFQPIDEFTPTIGSLTCQNVTCTNASVAGVFLYGLPENPIQQVTLQDVSISFQQNAIADYPVMADDIEKTAQKGIFAGNVKHLNLHNVQINGWTGEEVSLLNVTDFRRK